MEIAEIYNSLRSGKSISANDYYHMVSEGLPLSAVPKHSLNMFSKVFEDEGAEKGVSGVG